VWVKPELELRSLKRSHCFDVSRMGHGPAQFATASGECWVLHCTKRVVTCHVTSGCCGGQTPGLWSMFWVDNTFVWMQKARLVRALQELVTPSTCTGCNCTAVWHACIGSSSQFAA
jgi:hypothetical protein